MNFLVPLCYPEVVLKLPLTSPEVLTTGSAVVLLRVKSSSELDLLKFYAHYLKQNKLVFELSFTFTTFTVLSVFVT